MRLIFNERTWRKYRYDHHVRNVRENPEAWEVARGYGLDSSICSVMGCLRDAVGFAWAGREELEAIPPSERGKCVFHTSKEAPIWDEEFGDREFWRPLREYLNLPFWANRYEERWGILLGRAYDFSGFDFPKSSTGIPFWEEGEETVFNGSVIFEGATFRTWLHTSQVKFLGRAIFDDVVFHDLAYFEESTFSGFASFRRTRFLTRADFSQVVFEGGVSFRESVFKERGLFMGAKFLGRADFVRATFEVGDFAEAEFRAEADLSGIDVGTNLNMDGASFRGPFRLDGASIRLHSGFEEVTFGSDVLIRGSRFSYNLNLFKVKVDGIFDLSDSRIRNLDIYGSTFKGLATFDRCTFYGESAVVWYNKFHSHVSFRDAVFKTGFGMEKNRFKGDADFTGAQFMENSDVILATRRNFITKGAIFYYYGDYALGFLVRLKDLARRLKDVSDGIDVRLEVNPPVSEDRLRELAREAEKRFGVGLPDYLMDFYRVCNGLTFSYGIEGLGRVGSSRILPVEALVGEEGDVPDFGRKPRGYRKMRVFDAPFEDEVALLRLDDETYPVMIWRKGEKVIRPLWSLSEYLDNLLMTGAVRGWALAMDRLSEEDVDPEDILKELGLLEEMAVEVEEEDDEEGEMPFEVMLLSALKGEEVVKRALKEGKGRLLLEILKVAYDNF